MKNYNTMTLTIYSLLILILGTIPCQAKLNIFLLGSCCSEYFVPAENLILTEKFRGTNIISLMSEKLNISDAEIDSSPRVKQIIFRDANKQFLDCLSQTKFDILFMDFADERLDLFKIDNNKYICNSEYTMHKAKRFLNKIENMSKNQIVPEISRFTLWKDSFNRFMERVSKIIPTNRIYINKIYYSYKYKTSDNTEEYFDNEYSDAHNKMLNKYYAYIRENYPQINFIEHSNYLFTGKEPHKWGLMPLHYIDEYYRDLTDKLTEIDHLLSR